MEQTGQQHAGKYTPSESEYDNVPSARAYINMNLSPDGTRIWAFPFSRDGCWKIHSDPLMHAYASEYIHNQCLFTIAHWVHIYGEDSSIWAWAAYHRLIILIVGHLAQKCMPPMTAPAGIWRVLRGIGRTCACLYSLESYGYTLARYIPSSPCYISSSHVRFSEVKVYGITTFVSKNDNIYAIQNKRRFSVVLYS